MIWGYLEVFERNAVNLFIDFLRNYVGTTKLTYIR